MLHWRLGSNLPARGGVSCVGAVAQSICLHQWAGVAVGLGQQDPAKHQLLAAFYTDSHQVGHIYSTASSPVRLEDSYRLDYFFSSCALVLSVTLSIPSTACAICAYLSISVSSCLPKCFHITHISVYRGWHERITGVHIMFVFGPWHLKRLFDSLRWMKHSCAFNDAIFFFYCQPKISLKISVLLASTHTNFRTIYRYKITVFSVVIPLSAFFAYCPSTHPSIRPCPVTLAL